MHLPTLILLHAFYILESLGRRGSRRLSVSALVGMSMSSIETSNLSQWNESGTNAKQHLHRIRNKSIPIINPLVKTPNWPSTTTSHKKGMNNLISQYFYFMSYLCIFYTFQHVLIAIIYISTN